MSRKEREDWQAMIDAGSKLRAASNGLNEQAVGRNGQAVHAAVGTDRGGDV